MITALERRLPDARWMDSAAPLRGWMDDDAALAAGQLFGGRPSVLLVIDARELLVSTGRVIGLELGDLH